MQLSRDEVEDLKDCCRLASRSLSRRVVQMPKVIAAYDDLVVKLTILTDQYPSGDWVIEPKAI